MTKLYELPQRQNIRIKAQTKDSDGNILGEYIIFGRLDGMYSYCWVEGKPEKVCHLSAGQELKKVDDYYELVKNHD